MTWREPCRRFGGAANNIASDNGIHKTVDNEQQEDYAAYVERQKKTYDAMEQQKSAARQIFDELTPKNAEIGIEKEVLESKFREKLAASGFNDHDIDVAIKDMENDGLVERIVTELDGVAHDILRWR